MTDSNSGLVFPETAFFDLAAKGPPVDRAKVIVAAELAVSALSPQLRKKVDECAFELLQALLLVIRVGAWPDVTLEKTRLASDTVRDLGPMCGAAFIGRVARLLSDILDDITEGGRTVSADELAQFATAVRLGEKWSSQAMDSEINSLINDLSEISKRVYSARAK